MQLGKELGYRTWFGAEFLDCPSRSFDSAREDPISSTQRLSLDRIVRGPGRHGHRCIMSITIAEFPWPAVYGFEQWDRSIIIFAKQ